MQLFKVFLFLFPVIFAERISFDIQRASYWGGNDDDYSLAISSDELRGIFAITGFTRSGASFPELNPITGQNTSDRDGFISVFQTPDSGLLFSSRIGGFNEDGLADISFGSDGNLYFFGTTLSPNLLVSGTALYSTLRGESDCFMGYLNSTFSMVYNSYFGGSSIDNAISLAVDIYNNRIFIVGYTSSSDLPNATGAFAGGVDLFLSGFESGFQSLLFTTLLGGDSYDFPNDIELFYSVPNSPATQIYVAGTTLSSNLPLLNEFSAARDGSSDFIVAAYLTNGTRILTSYFGGQGDETTAYLQIDSGYKRLWICGQTYSSGLATPNATDTTLGGDADALIANFDITNFSAVTPVFITYFGGSGYEAMYGCSLDKYGNLHTIGNTLSNDFQYLNQIRNFSITGTNSVSTIFAIDYRGNLQYSTGITQNRVNFTSSLASILLSGDHLFYSENADNTGIFLQNPIQSYQGAIDTSFTIIDFNFPISTSSPLTTNSISTNSITTSPLTTNKITTSSITSGDFFGTSSQQEQSSSSNSNKTLFAAIGTVLGLLLLVLVAVSIFLYLRFSKKKENKEVEMGTVPSTNPKNVLNQIYDVEISKKLGEGTFGVVYLATWHGAPVAAKKLKGEEEWKAFQREAELLDIMKHPNVIQYLGIFIDESNSKYIITDYMNKGSLFDVLKREELSFEQKLNISIQCCRAMVHLEKAKCVHRDIATRNFLVSSAEDSKNFQVRLSDFGMARELVHQNMYNMKDGTIPVRWCAPEVLKSGTFSSKSDVWAFGVTLWEIFNNGAIPFASQSNKEVVDEVLNGGVVPQYDCPSEIYKIGLMCFEKKPQDRPSFAELLKKLEEQGSLSTNSETIYQNVERSEGYAQIVPEYELK